MPLPPPPPRPLRRLPARPPPRSPRLTSPQGRPRGLGEPREPPGRAVPRGRRPSPGRSLPRRCHAGGGRRGRRRPGRRGSAPSGALQRALRMRRAPAWLGARTAPAAGGGEGRPRHPERRPPPRGGQWRPPRRACEGRAGPRARPLAPRAAAGLRCRRARSQGAGLMVVERLVACSRCAGK